MFTFLIICGLAWSLWHSLFKPMLRKLNGSEFGRRMNRPPKTVGDWILVLTMAAAAAALAILFLD